MFRELHKNPLLTAKPLCRIIGIPFRKYEAYIGNLRSQWKANSKNELDSKRSTFHNWRGWAYVPKMVDRACALGRGWDASRNRNRAFTFRDRHGRLEWFETGRVNIWLRKPAHKGKLSQLMANAFSFTGLIPDPRVLQAFIDSVRYSGAHLTCDTGERLPYAKIEDLKDSHGIIVKTGDFTHPTSIEIEFYMPKWAEDAVEDRKAFVEIAKRLFNSGEHRPDKKIGVI